MLHEFFRSLMRVKKLYQTAVEEGTNMWAANLGLAQWMYYAPGIFGGGVKKGRNIFLTQLRHHKPTLKNSTPIPTTPNSSLKAEKKKSLQAT